MQSHFEKEMGELREKLLTMASHAETAVRNAVDALVNRDLSLAERVKNDDEIIDAFEVEIDELAVNLLVKAPLASQLRLIFISTKVSQNLERVGDEATKIAKRVADLSREAPLKRVAEIPGLSSRALQLLREALDSFVNQNAAAARELIPLDKQVDALNRKIHQDLASDMVDSPENINRALHLMVVAKSLERIADHAKNIAEEVVYLCEAEDIRHKGVAQSSQSE